MLLALLLNHLLSGGALCFWGSFTGIISSTWEFFWALNKGFSKGYVICWSVAISGFKTGGAFASDTRPYSSGFLGV